MQDILAHSRALIVDDKLKGLVPYLQLNAAGEDQAVPRPPGLGSSPSTQPSQSQTGQPQTMGQGR